MLAIIINAIIKKCDNKERATNNQHPANRREAWKKKIVYNLHVKMALRYLSLFKTVTTK